MKLNIVLHEPEIPQNTGNIARTCAATGAALHLIRPLGFRIDDAKLKRAGLDYWHSLDIFYYDGFSEFFAAHPDAQFYCFSTKAPRPYTAVRYPDDCYLIFGKETRGLPEDFLREEDRPNSLNHHMFGDISAWFIEYIGGIRVNPFLADPSEVEISPVFIEKLDSAEASYETVGGKVSVKWRRTLEGIALDISADSGVHGRIRLPDGYAFADEHGSIEELHSGNFEIIRE